VPKRVSERERMRKSRSRRDKNARATVLEARVVEESPDGE
jgi:hypothetical protein